MLSRVLALKWRPNSFDTLVGQEHVTKTLTNALNSGRLHHAYLFCGTRGVGKTTIARIFAKCLSCEQGVSSTPCNQCYSCKAIDEGSYTDLVEVDAASRTKVEDTRELLGDMQFTPVKGKYKIYLIDEVHMLSNHSFNALLKTLEEPQPHIIFLFATTEAQKLPVTVVSRCLKFNLRTISEEDIFAKLKDILHKEEVRFDEGSLRLISHYAAGSMRDALSLTDQAIAYCNGELVESEVSRMLGVDGIVPAEIILRHIAEGDLQKILDVVLDMERKGADFIELWNRIMQGIQRLSLILFNVAPDESDEMKTLASKFTKEELQLFYQISLITKRELHWAPSMRSASEMGFIKILNMQPLASLPSKVLSSRYDSEQLSKQEKINPEAERETQKVKDEEEEQKIDRREQEEMTPPIRAPEENSELSDSQEASPSNDEDGASVDKAEGETQKVKDEEEEQKIDRREQEETTPPIRAPEENSELSDSQEASPSNDEDGASMRNKAEGETQKVKDEEGEQKIDRREQEETTPPIRAPEENSELSASQEASPSNDEDGASVDKAGGQQSISSSRDYTQADAWAELVEELALTGIVDSLIRETRVVEIRGGIWYLHCLANVRERITDDIIATIEESIAAKTYQRVQLEVEVGAPQDTPALILAALKKKMVEDIKQEPIINTMLNKYGGKIDEESVRTLHK